MEQIEIYTDGACRRNGCKNNVGAYWGYLTDGKNTREIGSVVTNTTNNICELKAIIEALKSMKRFDIPVVVYSDSKYCVDGINEWSKKWIRTDFRTEWGGGGWEIKNRDLWKELVSLRNKFSNIKFVHIKGHSKIERNEYCDKKCNELMDNYEKEYGNTIIENNFDYNYK